ncbi:MAG: EamA family transporter [Rhizobiales bacterium]|nr:EamA family transporter [Hyphomicrobiales bacterium]
MLVSCALIAGVAALGRYVTTAGVPPMQAVFLRVIFALITMLPLLLWRGLSLARTEQWKTYTVRVAIGVCAMSSWFIGLSMVPVGEVTAISFLAPLFATIFAALLLKEVVRARRWMATLIGFAGALVILRPGLGDTSLGVWIIVFSATAMGLSTTFIKRLTNADDPDKVVFVSTLMMTPVTLLPALYVWQWPAPEIWPWLVAMGPVATLGHVMLARAFAATEASIVMGVDFARLPFAVLYGFLLFGEIIDVWTWVGAAIIFSSSIYIARRESKLRSQTPVPATPRIPDH